MIVNILYYFLAYIIDDPHNLNRRTMEHIRKICPTIWIIPLLPMDDISKSTTQLQKNVDIFAIV